MRPCPQCKTQVAFEAVSCPQCGYPLPKGGGTNWVLILVIAVGVSLLGCCGCFGFLYKIGSDEQKKAKAAEASLSTGTIGHRDASEAEPAEAAPPAPQVSGSASGTTAQVVEVELNKGKAVFDLTYRGEGNFIVSISDENGEPVDYIANEIGDWSGQKLVRIPKTGSYNVQVEDGNGKWEIRWR